MKKLIIALIIVAITFSTVMSFSMMGIVAYAANETLDIFNWAEYIDEDLLDTFAEYYNQKYNANLTVNYELFDTNEVMLTKVLRGDTKYDLICPSDYTIEKLMRKGILKKINLSKVTNYSNIDTFITDKISDIFSDVEYEGEELDMNNYMVPYMWGTLGILYNEDAVTEEDLELGWGILWNLNNNPKLNKKIYMKDSVRDSYLAAILYAKEQELLPEEYAELEVQDLINSVDETIISVVEGVLKDQRKVLKGYEVDFGKEDMIEGLANICLAWSGDAMYAIEEAEAADNGVSLNYFVPESGSNLWFDGWAMPTTCDNERAALEFINFMLDPESAILNMMEIGYTSAVSRDVLMDNNFVIQVLTDNEYDVEEFFEDEVRYPHELDEMLGVLRDFGDMSEAVIMMWENIKPGATISLIIILSVVVGVIGLTVLCYILFDKYRGSYKLVEKPQQIDKN